jgi:uncharacterized coiled-coil protein SlyX
MSGAAPQTPEHHQSNSERLEELMEEQAEQREPVTPETPELPHVSPSMISNDDTAFSRFSAALTALEQQARYQQQTIEALTQLVAQRDKAMEQVTAEMRATLEEMRDTMQLAQKALLDADSVTEKLGVGLAALATLEAKWEALYEIEQEEQEGTEQE